MREGRDADRTCIVSAHARVYVQEGKRACDKVSESGGMMMAITIAAAIIIIMMMMMMMIKWRCGRACGSG